MLYVRIGIILIAVVFLIFAIRALSQAVAGKTYRADIMYNVGRQQAAVAKRVAYMRGALFLLIALSLALIFAFLPSGSAPTEVVVESTVPMTDSTPTSLSPTAQPSPSATLTVAVTPTPDDAPLPAPVALTAVPTATNEPTVTITPTVTATPFITPTVRVNSPNGLYLREAPAGVEEVELLSDGTVLTVLDGFEQVGELAWQRVRTPAGNEGWVAVSFTTSEEPTATPSP
jgi:hypothetical protein